MFSKFKIPKISERILSPRLLTIVTNTGWLFVDKIVRIAVGLVIGIWLARYLGVEGYGLYNYALAFATLLSPFASLGLDSVVIRYIVREPNNRVQIIGTSFILKLLAGTLTLFAAIACIYLVSPNEKLTIELVAILSATGIFQSFDAIDLWFQSQTQSKYTVLAKSIVFASTSILRVVLIVNKAPLAAFAWVALLDIALGSVGLIVIYQLRGYSVWLWRWSWPLAKMLVKESWPLLFSSFAILIYMKIDMVMLKAMSDERAVGIYSAATRISEAWYFIPMIVSSSMAPAIYAAKESSETLFYNLSFKLHRFMALLSIVISISMTFLAKPSIALLFGDKYAAATDVLIVHIWASIFVFLGVASSTWLVAENLAFFTLYRTILGAIFNIGLNILLIPQYAGVGAAIATLISYAFANVFANLLDKKTHKLFWIQLRSLNMLSFASKLK
jgi:polysaccharide transporter, PST family